MLMIWTVAREQRSTAGDQHSRCGIPTRGQICLHTESIQPPKSSIQRNILAKDVNRWKCIRGSVDRALI